MNTLKTPLYTWNAGIFMRRHYFSLILAQTHRLLEADLTSTHNLCLEQKVANNKDYQLKNEVPVTMKARIILHMYFIQML